MVLALQFEKKPDGKGYIVRSYVNRKLDQEIQYNNRIDFKDDCKVTIGDNYEHRQDR